MGMCAIRKTVLSIDAGGSGCIFGPDPGLVIGAVFERPLHHVLLSMGLTRGLTIWILGS